MNTNLELLSKEDAVSITKIDAPMVSTDIQKYVKSNTFSYYVGINTWLYLYKEIDAYSWVAVLNKIKTLGLITVIHECDDDATRIVQGKDPVTDIGQLCLVLGKKAYNDYVGLSEDKNFKRDALATALQLLRYMKRFSPLHNDKIQKSTLDDFVQTENRNKQLQRKEYPYWLIRGLKETMQDILDWDGLCNKIESLTDYDFIPTAGSSAEGATSLGEKLAIIGKSHPDAFKAPFGLPYVFPFWEEDTDEGWSVVQAVPKSYKSSRIIAMEPAFRQAKANVIGKIMQRFLPDCVDITHQDRNQLLAWQGSRDGTLATLDASHASDTITKTLWRSIFPPRFVSLVDPLLSTHTRIGNKVRWMQMASTAGHSLTFIIETLVYYAVSQLALDIVKRYTGVGGIASVYGDDVIISTHAVNTVLDLYKMLGFIINIDKSYTSGPYRESCGEEYYNGISLSSTYYPRFPVIGEFTNSGKVILGSRMYRDSYRGKIDDSTSLLVDLQHRLFTVSYGASVLVASLVREARPKITSSISGSTLPDLWDVVESAPRYTPTGYTPEGKKVELLPSVAQACTTTLHSYAALQFNLKREVQDWELRFFDIYKYQSFLKHGPSFSDPLLELLGVSDRPLTVREGFGKGMLVWKRGII